MDDMDKKQLFETADRYREKIKKSGHLPDYFRTRFIWSSNSLEGNTLTFSETEQIIQNGKPLEDKPVKDCLEVLGHSKAYDFMLQAVREMFPLTEDVILRLHRLFLEPADNRQAGIYRTGTQGKQTDGYQFPASSEISHLMIHFLQQMDYSCRQFHPIEFAALCHKRILDIHPFEHGSGQIARLILNILLLQSGYGLAILSLTRKTEYADALTESRKPGFPQIDPLVRLIAECVINTEEKICQDLTT